MVGIFTFTNIAIVQMQIGNVAFVNVVNWAPADLCGDGRNRRKEERKEEREKGREKERKKGRKEERKKGRKEEKKKERKKERKKVRK